MSWLDDFKIALIEEDEERLSSLITSMPNFETIDEMKSAMHLIDQAKTLFEKKKESLAKQMKEIEASKKFLTSSENSANNGKFDITS
ncbi:hypothetical protein [Hydrogenimonas sp.]|uniref:hypothetical protein n=1 Tax=Hydrogenimonas sp. TaxID=2231112 RepID=UPI002615C6EC|nr:hypothetical protein [Hydrogenimonas sp.]